MARRKRPRFIIDVDGSFSPQTGAGAWAAVVRDEQEGTTQRLTGTCTPAPPIHVLELQAMLCGLAAVPDGSRVEVRCDAKTVVDVAERRRENVERKTYEDDTQSRAWAQFDAHVARLHDAFALRWVRAHAGDPGNTEADRLARAARKHAEAALRA